jgi:hypothetical protein
MYDMGIGEYQTIGIDDNSRALSPLRAFYCRKRIGVEGYNLNGTWPPPLKDFFSI